MSAPSSECALAIGRRITALGKEAEDNGLDVRVEMNRLLMDLANARSDTIEDAHALTLVSWLLLLEGLKTMPRDSETEIFASNCVQFVTVFGRRAVQTLEALTGMPFEVFAGGDRYRQ